MQLQRERMAQTLVIDQHSRRVLHDEVLTADSDFHDFAERG